MGCQTLLGVNLVCKYQCKIFTYIIIISMGGDRCEAALEHVTVVVIAAVLLLTIGALQLEKLVLHGRQGKNATHIQLYSIKIHIAVAGSTVACNRAPNTAHNAAATARRLAVGACGLVLFDAVRRVLDRHDLEKFIG